MKLTKGVGLLAGFGALSIGGVGFAGTNGETNTQDLLDRLAAAEARIAELELTETDAWMTEQRAGEIRSIVQDVLADADTRASLLQSGGTAGWDNGFFLASADGNFRMNISGQLQVRWVSSSLDDSSNRDQNRQSFEIRRAKLIFEGHVIDPTIEYKIQGNFGSSGNDTLEDAWIKKTYDNGWWSSAGQFKAPLLREELVSSKYQQTVERSLTNELFTADRTQGIAFGSENDNLRWTFAYTDGARRANSPWNAEDTEWGAITARLEWLAQGDWDQFKDFTSKRGSDTGMMFGVAAHVESAEYGTGDGSGFSFNDDESTTTMVTVDGSYEADGWNAFAGFIYRNNDFDTSQDTDQWAVVLQGAVYLNDTWEFFLRYEYADLDLLNQADISILTWGSNFYFDGHANKLTWDSGYAFDSIAVGASTQTGWQDSDSDGQWVTRLQWQLLF